MNLRWLIGNFADPQYRLSGKEQRELSWLAHSRHLPGRKFFLWTLFFLVVPVLLVYKFLLPTALKLLGYNGGNLPFLIGATIVVFLFWIWSAWIYRALYIHPMRRAMRERGYNLCIGCGYLLDGLPEDASVCPECGTSLEGNRGPSAGT